MISATSTTENYILQPELIEKHTKTIGWLSASMLWKSELTSFQKILDQRAMLFTAVEDKKKIDHFQNLLIYYKGEVVDGLRKKLRDHETRLANILETLNEQNTQYYKEHDQLMDEAITFSDSFKEFRNGFLALMQKTGS
jgi:hypothetical protein